MNQASELSYMKKYGKVRGYRDVNFVVSKDMCQTFPAHPISIYFWLR